VLLFIAHVLALLPLASETNIVSDGGYRGEVCQRLDLDPVEGGGLGIVDCEGNSEPPSLLSES
jgi:hypothetical protein